MLTVGSAENTRDYREYLKTCFNARRQANPRYSLRAFARDIDCKVSSLSLIFNKKREISTASAAKIAQALELSSSESRYFLDLVHLSRAKNTGEKKIYEVRVRAQEEVQQRKPLQMDVFQLISDWYHSAILELTYVEGFRSDPDWIARKLDLSKSEVIQALERLKRLGLIEEKNGVLKKRDRDLSTATDVPSQALRNICRQLIHKSLLALETQDINERDFGTITFSGNPSKLAKAKKIISQARREVCQLMETGTASDVYCFTTQLFKVTK